MYLGGGGGWLARNIPQESEDKLCQNKLLEFDEPFKAPSSDEEEISL